MRRFAAQTPLLSTTHRLALAALLVGCALPASAQTTAHAHKEQHAHPQPEDPVVAAFVTTARKATEKFQDLDAAVAAGYRQLGPDFPGMGEHWVNVRSIVRRELDPERPPVLSYLRIDGEPVLTGVAYALPVRAGEAPPDFIRPGLWHFHSGTLDEETLLLNPHGMHHKGASDAPRLAMFHAWIWAENPAGLFEQDNWALPFLRLGMAVPAKVPPQAGKALFLLTDGVGYYARLIEVAGAPSPEEQVRIRAVLSAYHDRVRTLVEPLPEQGTMPDHDVIQTLVEYWHALWAEIESAVSPALWGRIEMLAG